MLVPVGWLQNYLLKPLKPKALIDYLEKAGIEVERVLANRVLDPKIKVAQVTGMKAHPNANKLKLATIRTDSGQVTVVCGATNMAVGQKVAYAAPGSTLPNGTKITRTRIRGQDSPGMICSPKELGLGSDHDGILVLESRAKLGSSPIKPVDATETVVEVKTAANRSDLQSMVGIAREVAAHAGSQLKNIPDRLELASSAKPTLFETRAKELVGRYSLARLRLPKAIPPTPKWMEQRLEASGIRPIGLVIDITNYVMLETGQPLHAFDATKVTGKIIVRTAKKGEKTTTLDAKNRTLTTKDIVIADSRKIVGIGGVMGSRIAEISDQTKDILVEAATFDGTSIRMTAISQGLRTEASARFERQLPTQYAGLGLNRTIELLQKLAAARLEKIDDELNIWPWVQHIGVRPQRLSQLAGREISSKQTISGLKKLGFTAANFDIIQDAKRYLGKPYKAGANFRADGVSAFDCSYLTDYLYSLIGKNIGHTSLGQFELGQPVDVEQLKPGDNLFYEGVIIASAIDHYYYRDEESKRVKRALAKPKKVGHNGLYIGGGKVIHATSYQFEDGKWQKRQKPGVITVPLDEFTKNPGFLGVRRYIENLNGYLTVTAPWWRPDVKTEEDVLEEVIKLVGLDDLPTTLPAWQPPPTISYDQRWSQLWDLRGTIAGLGLVEAVTYPFVSQEQIEQLGFDPKQHLKLRNPRSIEQAYLRTNLLPGLLEALARNTNHRHDFGLFEEARVFLPQLKTPLPTEVQRLGIIIQHSSNPYPRVKSVLDNLVNWLHLEVNLQPTKRMGWLHPNRAAWISLEGQRLGYLGQLHPDLLTGYKLRGQAGYLELDLDSLLASVHDPTFELISPYQVIHRDLTLVLDRKVAWQQISDLLNAAGLTGISYGGDYAGPNSNQRQRALTIRIAIVPDKPGYRDEDANQRVAEVAKLLKQNFKARIKE